MAKQVSVYVESVPDGDDVELPGLGVVPNNGTKEVTDTQIQLYKGLGFEWPDDDHLVIKVPPDPVEELMDEDKKTLLSRAADLDIEGRSKMTKEELAAAITEHEANAQPAIPTAPEPGGNQ